MASAVALGLLAVALGAFAPVIAAMLPRGHGHSHRLMRARSDASAIVSAATMWIAEHSARCPTVLNLVEEGQLDRSKNSADPWGTAYSIECRADFDIRVHSAGPDRILHTADDING